MAQQYSPLQGFLMGQKQVADQGAQEMGILSKILQMKQMQDQAAIAAADRAEMRPLQMDALRSQIEARNVASQGALQQRQAQGMLSGLLANGGYTGPTTAPTAVAGSDAEALRMMQEAEAQGREMGVNVPSPTNVRALTSIAFPAEYGKAQAAALFPKPVAPQTPRQSVVPVTGGYLQANASGQMEFVRTQQPGEAREPAAPVAVVTRDGKGAELVSRAQAVGRTPANVDPDLQGRLAGAKQAGRGSAQAAQATADDQKGAMRALKAAGYDPATGKDNISDLIDASTSGIVQRGAAAIPGAFGISTSGMVALRTVESMANSIVLDLMNRKLGAGISNADRDFIVSQLGDVGNAIKPAEERKAAWKSARDRMIEVGLHPSMGGGASNSQTPTATPNSDLDAALSKYGPKQ